MVFTPTNIRRRVFDSVIFTGTETTGCIRFSVFVNCILKVLHKTNYKMKIAIGNDHAGTELKKEIKTFLEEMGYEVINFGTDSIKSVDYPDYVHPVTNCVQNNEVESAILICGSAQGVAIAANKYPNIRAAVCWETEIASLARKHNNANVLCLPARFISKKKANSIVLIFLQTEFEGGRHQKRIEKIASCCS
jgi:ribose 5-phosphate isomerase B